jgi:hypothetical protein
VIFILDVRRICFDVVRSQRELEEGVRDILDHLGRPHPKTSQSKVHARRCVSTTGDAAPPIVDFASLDDLVRGWALRDLDCETGETDPETRGVDEEAIAA